MTYFNPQPKTGYGGKKKPATYVERMHMDAVAQECCVVTGRSTDIVLHHPYHDRIERYGGKKAPHLDVIPLWQGIHQGLLGHPHEVKIHGMKQGWRELYGPDWGYIPDVRHAVYNDPMFSNQDIIDYWESRR